MRTVILGIDIGTTSTKGILAAPDGRILAEHSAESQLVSRQPGWAEEDARQWWANTGIVCRALLAAVPDAEVAAVGVSGMVPTIVLLDADNKPLRDSIQQNDSRAHVEIEAFKQRLDNTNILQRTGSPITQQSIAPKLAWLWKHEPDTMRRVRRVMGSYDYINTLLTGEATLEQNWALESGMYDLQQGDWYGPVLELAQTPRAWLGPVRASSEVIGTITHEAAAHTGLKAGTPVVAGSADHVASAFAAGLRQPNDLLVKLGGAGDILLVLDRYRPDPRLFIDHHVIPGQFLINGCMAASGSLIRWFQQQFASGMTYAELDAEARAVPPGADGLVALPYFLGEKTPIFDPTARGILFGLTLSHTRAHIFRAVLEAISFGFYHHLQVLAESGFTPAPPVMVTNGGAHSALWRQVTADVLGLALHALRGHPGSALGAMFVAGKGVGLFADWADIQRFLQIETVTEPEMQAHAFYKERFQLYRDLYEVNRPLFARLL